MKCKLLITMTIFLILIFTLSACNTEYDKHVSQFRNLFDDTMNLLDPDNVYESITRNQLDCNLENLTLLIKKIEETVPKNKYKEFMVLKQQYELLEDIIQKGLKWDTLDWLDQLSVKESLDILKPKK